MKVTFCSYDKPDNVGGPFTWIANLLPGLRERGVEVRCLFLLHWGHTGPALSALLAAGIPCDAVVAHDTTEDRMQWILSKLAEDPPDVFVPNFVVAALHASRFVREAGIRTVAVLHSDDPFYHALIDQFVTGDSRNAVSDVVCVSRELERQVAPVAWGTVSVRRIPYGVDIPGASVRREPGTLRLAYVGRLAEEQKRISEVVGAFLRVTDAVPGCSAVIYGDGPDRGAVERLLAGHRGGGRVKLHGPVPHEELASRLLDIDVIVLLSDYEGLPIALLEAMACGCVPVSRAIRSGIPELIDDERTGLLVDDPGPAFDRAIRRLHSDPALWQRLSLSARGKIVSEFSKASSIDAWAAFLRGIASSRSPGSRIRVPVKYKLPPVHPQLESADARRVTSPHAAKFFSRSRMFAGRLKKAVREMLMTRPG